MIKPKKLATVLSQMALSILGLIWIVSGCSRQEPAASTVPELTGLAFDEELVLGLETDIDSTGYFFERPEKIRTDGEGRIYVKENGASSIMVFDSEGNFLQSIGQEGEGPGEYSAIRAIEINTEGELIAFDEANRRITRSSNNGEVLETLIPQEEDMVWPEDVRQIGEDRYLVLRKMREIPNTEDPEERLVQSTFMHLFDNSFQNRITSLVDIDSVMDEAGDFMRNYAATGNPGYFWPAEGEGIWYVPGIYDGRIFRFSERRDGSGWTLVETLQGETSSEEPFELDSSAEGAVSIVLYTPVMQVFSALIYSQSLGVFTLNDGRLVHFSSQLTDTSRVTQVELFNSEGELEGVGNLGRFTFDSSEQGALIGSIWKDEDDRFYLIDRSGVPVIRVGRLTGL